MVFERVYGRLRSDCKIFESALAIQIRFLKFTIITYRGNIYLIVKHCRTQEKCEINIWQFDKELRLLLNV